MDKKIKHLELIQSTISRMAGNLFYLKGWSITLVTALFALYAKDGNTKHIMIIYFPIIIFWILDGYFLSQERLFRCLYNDVREKSESEIDFSMDTNKFKKATENGWLVAMFAPTLLFFYIPLIITSVLIHKYYY